MAICFSVTIITSLLTSVSYASDTSSDSILKPALKTRETSDEIMDVAENVVFRPYFQHPHSLHHHSQHHTHPQTQAVPVPQHNNIIRRSYSTSEPAYKGYNPAAQTWYTTPNNYYNYGRQYNTGAYPMMGSSVSSSDSRRCYCLPASESHQKPEVNGYNQDYYNKVASYYGNYYSLPA